MPEFVKTPKFIIGAIIAAWVIYIITANSRLNPIQIRLLPFLATLQFNVSAVIVVAAIFGAAVTLIAQHQWKRWNSSKPASTSATGESNRTVA